ncbi:unannotated protein [freshwater metagenome]|uniref:adenine phosphoribosyltransferase n=1 Tax=freshwater metagenome TaxID=449393 RepID=A0A6J7XQT6_9ZZZZ|nr:adenine phosphoribosyltransferase [Actinomycetota bacterium]
MKIAQALGLIREVPNFPEPGIRFQDITPLLANGEAFLSITDALGAIDIQATLVAGIEARGFILAAAIAQNRSIGFIPLRKKGKLPHTTYSQKYGLEYGIDELEIHQDAVTGNSHVFIIDDVLATGGTAIAAIDLVRRAGGTISDIGFLLEIEALGGRDRIHEVHPDITITSLAKK